MARYAKFFSLGGGGGPNNLQLPVGTILDATLRQVQDGTGTNSPLYLSTGSVRIGTTAGSAMYWDNTNNRLGIGTATPTQVLDIVTTTQIPLKLSNNQTFVRTLYSNNSASGTFDFINNYFSFGGNNLVVGSSNNLNARLGVVGSGSTSATTSLLVQNSAGTNLLEQKDDGSLYVGTTASDLGVIYVPHSPTYAQRTFLRMQSGGVQIFATSSNDGLVVKTLGTTFEQKITINDGVIYGKSTAVATNVSAYNLPTQILCSSTANSCLINLSGGGRLQGSSDAQYIRIEGTILIDSLSNELKGFYFNPTLTGAFSPQNVLAIHSTYGGAYLNTATPQASAVLQADSTTQGFHPE